MPIDADLTTTLENLELRNDGDQTTCRVEVHADADRRTLPLHVVFCIDTSGSMNAELDGLSAAGVANILGGVEAGSTKISNARTGVGEAIENLDPSDTYAVTRFSRNADTVVPPTGGGGTAPDAVTSLSANGGTDIQAGIDESKSLLDSMPDRDAIEWIIVVTDGHGNFDADATANRIGGAGVTIHSAGIGVDYDEDIVDAMARDTRGESTHIGSAEKLAEFFVKRIDAARGVVATDPTLSIRPQHANVEEVYYTLGEQITAADGVADGARTSIELADLSADTTPEVLLDLTVPPHEEDLDVPLVDLELEVGGTVVQSTVSGMIVEPDIRSGDTNLAIRDDFRTAKASHLAVTEGGEAAEQYLAAVENDESESATLAEAKDEIGTLTDASSEDERRQAKDGVSRMLARKDEDE